MTRNPRENLILSGFICIAFGAFLSVGGVYSIGATIGICGLITFTIGMGLRTQMGMSEKAIQEWTPSGEALPDAGRVMYRVDVTLDKPVKSTILCGSCGHVETVDGSKPSTHTCSKCSVLLWEAEEE